MLRIALTAAAVAASFLILPMDSAQACHNNGSGNDPNCGVPAPVAAAGLPALFALGAGMLAVLRRRRRE